MLKRFLVFFAAALAVLLVLCWIYLPSFSRYHELKQEEERLSRRIGELDSQIKLLTDEKYLLQNDVAYLEKVIREELGFVKPGEVIYDLVTRKNSTGPVAVAEDPKPATTTVAVTAPAPDTRTPTATSKSGSSRKVRAPSSRNTSAKRT